MKCEPDKLILNRKGRDKYNDYRVYYRKDKDDDWLTYPCVAPFNITKANQVYIALNNVGFEVNVEYVAPKSETLRRMDSEDEA